jgi:hypothetical protein
MSTAAAGGMERKSFLSRIWCLWRHPRVEWPVIADETGGIRSLYFRYVLPLVLIGPVCGYVGGMLFGVKMGALVFPPDPVSAAFGAAAAVGLHLVGVYLLSRLIDALAPAFDGEPNPARAFKLAAYSATPVWLSGIFALYPPIWILGVVGLYGFYLLYRGIPVMMRTRSPRPWLYALVAGMSGLVLVALAGVVPASITRINLVPKPGVASRWDHRHFRFPGMDDQRRIARVLAQSQAVKQQLSAADRRRPPIKGEELQTLLPASLWGGFTRTAVQSSDQKLGPITVAKAKAVYVAPKSRITLQVFDMGAAGSLADELKPNAESDNAHGYAKLGLVDGRMTSEQYDRDAHSGSYGVVVAGRFAVKADGEQVAIGDLQKAVKAIDFDRLEAMARG